MPAESHHPGDDAAEHLKQYRAGLEDAITFDRGHLASLVVSGKDRESFLQNMLSGDIKKLARGSGRPASFLTVKGKLVSDMAVLLDGERERVYLEVESERAEPLRAALDRYIISEDVTLALGLEALEARFSIEGPRASSRLGDALDDLPRAELDRLGHLDFRWAHRGKTDLQIVTRSNEPSPRFDVVGPAGAITPLLDELHAAGVARGSESVRETRRVEAGYPRFGIDMDESHLPLEAALDDAVSFDKGCYIGQEYIVRLAHRGHLNRKLRGLKLESDSPPSAGAPVASESADEVGHVTSAAFSPTLERAIALAWLRREVFEPGTRVRVNGTAATVESLPFLPTTPPS